eukprot:CAMPEP_0172660822 /NCGR_PEP_ID=MMETSP1074-20121228/4277_1 /TAXON_ID=2916 /ORGANISM="Ceratium fusus, Strain PA161109" /LENGTH=644 /DNA_ID=CAMNT_0013476471 /DNA_START=73 /DNA_END=2007 /DNA_ORIENTATION=+
MRCSASRTGPCRLRSASGFLTLLAAAGAMHVGIASILLAGIAGRQHASPRRATRQTQFGTLAKLTARAVQEQQTRKWSNQASPLPPSDGKELSDQALNNPLSKFRMEELLPSMPKRTFQALRDRNIEAAAPIQASAIPLLYKGASAIIQSETGSGKTLAYLLPALERAREFDLDLELSSEEQEGAVLVVVPTRELGVQLLKEAELLELCEGELALVIEAAIAPWDAIRSASLIIASPTELLEVFDKFDAEDVKELLARVRTCIVDEFDELLPERRFEGKRRARYQDPGLWPTEALLKRLIRNNDEPELQIIAVSATAGAPSRAKLSRTLRTDQLGRFDEPLRIITPQGVQQEQMLPSGASASHGNLQELRLREPECTSLPSGIKHLFWKVNFGGSHAAALSAALHKVKPESALVFVCPNAGESTQLVVEELQDRGWTSSLALTKELFPDSGHNARSRHKGRVRGWRSANKLEELREITREGSHANQGHYWDAPVIVSAEERVRGLHLDAVEAVFILGLPKSGESYMHMAGRTGRLPHPFGQSVLVANGRELTKVLRKFDSVTGIVDWTHLGTGSPSRDEQEVLKHASVKRAAEHRAKQRDKVKARVQANLRREGSPSKASDGRISGSPPKRTTAGARLDDLLWR